MKLCHNSASLKVLRTSGIMSLFLVRLVHPVAGGALFIALASLPGREFYSIFFFDY